MGLIDRADVAELAPNLYAIAGRNKSRFPFCNAFLMTGDETVLIDTGFGPWYGNPECEIKSFIEGIRRVMAYPYERVCSSHKPAIEGGAIEYFEKFLEGFEKHRQMILKLCHQPASLDQMTAASPFYHDRLKDKTIQYLFERNMIRKNLDLLIRDGRVRVENGLLHIAGN